MHTYHVVERNVQQGRKWRWLVLKEANSTWKALYQHKHRNFSAT